MSRRPHGISSAAADAARRRRSRSCPLSVERLEDRQVFDATVINVDTTDDVVEDDGLTSLREAIDQANVTEGDVTIVLGSGNYGLSLDDGEGYGARGDNANEYGDLDVDRSGLTGTLTIQGQGQGSTTIHGNSIDRVFEIYGATVAFQDLTITGGLAHDAGEGYFADRYVGDDETYLPGFYLDVYESAAAGGGVLAIQSVVSFVNVSVDDNHVVFDTSSECECGKGDGGDAYGGGVMGSESNLTFVNSTVSNNTAEGSPDYYDAVGGGIYITDGELQLISTVVRDNAALGGEGSGEGYGFSGSFDSGSGYGYSYGSGAAGGNAYGGGIGAEGGLYLYNGSGSGATPFSGGETFVHTENSTISGNRAQGGAGAFVSVPNSVNQSWSGLNSVYYRSYDGGYATGGGVYLGAAGEDDAAYGEFLFTTIVGNVAVGGAGGAIPLDDYYLEDYYAGNINGIDYFNEYYVDAGSGGGAYGGGLAVEYYGSAIVDHSTIAGNLAQGGAGGTISAQNDAFSGAPLNFSVYFNSGGGRGEGTAEGGDGYGGGVSLYESQLQFTFSTASGNAAVGGAGGSIQFSSELPAKYDEFARAGDGGWGEGGGVELESSFGYLYNSTIAGNLAAGGAAGTGTRGAKGNYGVVGGYGLGGGIGLNGGYSGSSALIAELTTIAFNQAVGGAGDDGATPGYGGGIYAGGDPWGYGEGLGEGSGSGSSSGSDCGCSGGPALAAYGEGGGGGYVSLQGTLVGDNVAAGGEFSSLSNDIAAYDVEANYVLIENPNGILGSIYGSQLILNQDPQLLPLGNYGGSTQTVALASTSPAVDPVFSDAQTTPPEETFLAFAAEDPNAPPQETDQRGVLRPQDGNGDGFGSNDIGAFELEFQPEIPQEPPTEDAPREPTEGALPVPPVLPPPVFIPFQTVPLGVGQVATASYGTYTVFPNLKDVWVRLYRIEQRGGRKVTVLVTAIMVNNSDTGLRAALFALRKMPPGLYQITIDLAKSELIIWEGQYPKDVDAASRRLDQVENVLRTLQGPEQFRKELIEGAQPVPVTDPGSYFQAPTPSTDPALSETHTVLADSRWRQRAQVPGRSAEVESAPPAYVDMSIVWLGDDEEVAPPVAAEPALAE